MNVLLARHSPEDNTNKLDGIPLTQFERIHKMNNNNKLLHSIASKRKNKMKTQWNTWK